MQPVSFHRPNNCYKMGEMGTVRLHAEVLLGVPLRYAPEVPKPKKTWVFSQDLSHAMADQSMCKFFDIISSSLFICVAHFWDPVTKKRECEGTHSSSHASLLA